MAFKGLSGSLYAARRSQGNMRRKKVELLPPGGHSLRTVLTPPRDVIGFAVAAFIGVAFGVAGAFLAGRAPDAKATYISAYDLRDAPLAGAAGSRSELIARIAALGVSERLDPPASPDDAAFSARPRLVIIFDDMGLDKSAFREVMAMPGPVTLSFLPYANDVQPLVNEARRRGDDILLHLPMEPSGSADPGPHSLGVGMKSDAMFDELLWNLGRFDGYVGVNNHMGSRFTRDEQAMKRVLSLLDQRGLFFLDSLTTGGSAVPRAAAAVGAETYARDVFLDAEPGAGAVQRQLALAEAIALKTGYAIVICHPRRETLDIIGPWLTTAPARGFELATISGIRGHSANTFAAAP